MNKKRIKKRKTDTKKRIIEFIQNSEIISNDKKYENDALWNEKNSGFLKHNEWKIIKLSCFFHLTDLYSLYLSII